MKCYFALQRMKMWPRFFLSPPDELRIIFVYFTVIRGLSYIDFCLFLMFQKILEILLGFSIILIIDL